MEKPRIRNRKAELGTAAIFLIAVVVLSAGAVLVNNGFSGITGFAVGNETNESNKMDRIIKYYNNAYSWILGL